MDSGQPVCSEGLAGDKQTQPSKNLGYFSLSGDLASYNASQRKMRRSPTSRDKRSVLVVCRNSSLFTTLSRAVLRLQISKSWARTTLHRYRLQHKLQTFGPQRGNNKLK